MDQTQGLIRSRRQHGVQNVELKGLSVLKLSKLETALQRLAAHIRLGKVKRMINLLTYVNLLMIFTMMMVFNDPTFRDLRFSHFIRG